MKRPEISRKQRTRQGKTDQKKCSSFFSNYIFFGVYIFRAALGRGKRAKKNIVPFFELYVFGIYIFRAALSRGKRAKKKKFLFFELYVFWRFYFPGCARQKEQANQKSFLLNCICFGVFFFLGCALPALFVHLAGAVCFIFPPGCAHFLFFFRAAPAREKTACDICNSVL